MAQRQIPVLDQYEYQRPVKSRNISIPPISPSRGDRYIIGLTPSGDWVDHYRHIAECVSVGPIVWDFTIPRKNMIVPVDDENKLYYYLNSKWQDLALVLSGKRVVEQVQTSKILTVEDSGKVFNSYETTECVYTLPDGVHENVGVNFTFIRAGSGKLTINAMTGDKIADSTATGTIYSDAVDESCTSLTLLLVTAGHWSITAGHGSWITLT